MSKMSNYRPNVRRILLVDDEQDILDSLRQLFEALLENAEVYSAPSGEKALEILKEHEVDAILSDYKMPGIDGVRFLAEAREMQPHAARILITAFPDQALAQRALAEAGVQNFFTKPIQAEQVLEAVNAAVLKIRKQA